MRIALAGNPNSGKTTLYNGITGKAEHVGNWSGVTVSKKEADLKKKYNLKGLDVRIVDLPGTYSISPFTGEEAITRDFILDESPDVIINIVDGANVSRSLFFTTQLLELGVPVVIALNKNDIISKRGDSMDISALSKALNCKVVATTATSEDGLLNLITEAIKLGQANGPQVAPNFEEKDSDIARQKFVDSIVLKCQVKKRDASKITLSDKVDRIVADKWLGIPIFLLIMWGVFAFSIEGLGGFLSGYFNDVVFGEIIPNAANGFLGGLGISPLLQALIVDGAIGGVGAVVGFLPLVMVLFFCLSLLEDCGYMARVAVVMDRFFKKIGLSGKSIIPMIVGSGCAIPGVMATRTIEDINERRMTTILTPFVPCGAKLPIIALFVAVFFPKNSWVGPSMYLIAIVMIVIGGLLLKKIFVWDNTSQFIMELPEYKLPSLKYAFNQMIEKAKAFIYKAATIVLVCNTLVWFAQAYSWSFSPVTDQSTSILATIGSVISPIFIPLGFVGWQLAAAAITGFIAKENIVATFAVLLAVTSEEALHLPGGALTHYFTPVTAFAYLVFNLFTPPCFAAIGAMNSEMGSKKWLFKALGFQFSVGYILAMLVTQIGSLIVYGTPAVGFVPAIIIAIIAIIYLVITIRKADSKRIELGVEV
ncbi:ferrous iron transport protein B [Clostridium lacusfryxellense]|uniref:ferrous iron transport protein B n=1 Tax=Clostridium lacusfryxellense TaxID=205328 RepID=UPI001C0C70FD|nr:ferrous iron transport protein B [Clostridium lacusfryxellense]MBU3113503.1 ferrous iron transport protein B [Clostridium lacusfryxellense]